MSATQVNWLWFIGSFISFALLLLRFGPHFGGGRDRGQRDDAVRHRAPKPGAGLTFNIRNTVPAAADQGSSLGSAQQPEVWSWFYGGKVHLFRSERDRDHFIENPSASCGEVEGGPRVPIFAVQERPLLP